jgi:hypothetical protein
MLKKHASIGLAIFLVPVLLALSPTTPRGPLACTTPRPHPTHKAPALNPGNGAGNGPEVVVTERPFHSPSPKPKPKPACTP